MKTKEHYTKDHTVDLSQEPNDYPPDYQAWLDEQDVDWYKPLDADKKAQDEFLQELDSCPF